MTTLLLVLLLCTYPIAQMGLRLFNTDVAPPATARLRIPPPPFPLNRLIRVASRRHRVNPAFVKSIIAAESNFAPDAVSSKGALGLMQLMPETAHEYGAQDPTIPEQNVDAGTHYLSWLLRRYEKKRDSLRRTIAAYNAGPGTVDRYHGVPPYRETKTYVTRVLAFYKKYQAQGLGD